jgi:hypothetical protein
MSGLKQLTQICNDHKRSVLHRALADRPFLVSQVDACPSV